MGFMPRYSGWVQVDIPATSASQTGVGTTFSAIRTLTEAVDLGPFQRRRLQNFFPNSYTRDAGVTGTLALQGRINSSWTDLMVFTQDDTSFLVSDLVTGTLTGILDAVRVRSTVSVGAGTLSGTYGPVSLFYLYPFNQERFTTP